MICQQFEQLAQQIAHNELRDAKLLQDAHTHAESCANCNALLIEAREIAATVASLAAHDKSVEAPAHLESTLRAAFIREHVANSGLLSVDSARRSNFVGSTFRWAALSLAAAAVILAVIFLPRLIHRNSGQDVAQETPSHSSSPAITPAKTAPVAPAVASEPSKHFVAIHKPKKHLSEPEKTLTGFLALPYGDDLSTVEYGAIVRMQMSRADLAWLGLPVPVSDNGEKIVADLFVNGSGTPEAIRLVR
jgi:hypothetical protein